MRTLFRLLVLLGGTAVAPNLGMGAEAPHPEHGAGLPVGRPLEVQYVAPAPGYPPGQYYAPGRGYPGNYAPVPPPPQYYAPPPYYERRFYAPPVYVQPYYGNRFCARYPWRC
jgi:hypothetical protein